MPFKYNQPRRHKFKPMKYRVNNWREYNLALRNRGDITIWFNDKAIKSWLAKSNGKPHGQRFYSHIAIETACLLRLIFRLPLRQTEGFMKSITKLMNINLPIPNYTTLSRRMKTLKVKLAAKAIHKPGTHIIIDGSGLSVYGADEFKQTDKGKKQIGGYRRLNIAINEYQEITACELTTIHESENKQVPKLLKRIRDHCEVIVADKNYDDKFVYDAIENYRPTRYVRPVKRDTYRIVIPPQRNTRIRKYKRKYPLVRSEHMIYIKEHGAINWQKTTGYGIRSLVEVAFSRYKRLFSKQMKSINFCNQQIEAQLVCKALNIMLSIGMPETIRVS